MLDFCPYESNIIDRNFLKIDTENLAYEIEFYKGYNYDWLKETVIGSNYTDFIVENSRDSEIFNDRSNHYILCPSIDGKESGLNLLKTAIDKGNKELHEQKEETEGLVKEREKLIEEMAGSTEVTFKKKEKIGLECDYDKIAGNYIISSARESRLGKRPIMKAVPCCPNCFMPLPVGWMKADEFYPISLMGRTYGGKTTYLLSLMANDWGALTCLDSSWIVTPAHEEDIVEGEAEQTRGYEWMKQASVKMVEEGICPDPTQTEFPVKPVFLNIITTDGHSLIVGMYDNSGENLKEMATTDPKMLLLSCMQAHIYFIDPTHTMLPVEDNGKASEEKSEWKEITLMSLEEQGRFQMQQKKEQAVLASDLLRQNPSEKNRKGKKHESDPLQILKRYQRMLVNMHVVKQMKEQKVYVTLTKCDLLENIPEIKAVSFSDILFQRGTQETLFKDQMLAREEIVKDIFNRFVFTDASKERFLKRTLKSYSYHCISALGCATVKTIENGKKVTHLSEEYNPIRVAEPVAYCIKEKINELGWEQEDF